MSSQGDSNVSVNSEGTKLAKIVEDNSERKTRKIVISKSKLAFATNKKETPKEEPIDQYENMQLDDDDDILSSDDDIDVESESRQKDASRMTVRQRAMVLGETEEPLYSLANYKEGDVKPKPSKTNDRTRNLEERRQPSAQSMKEIEEVINQLLCVSTDKKDRVDQVTSFDKHSTHNRWTSNPNGTFVSFSEEEYNNLFKDWLSPIHSSKSAEK